MENRASGSPNLPETAERKEAGGSLDTSQVRSAFQGPTRRSKKNEVVEDHSKQHLHRMLWAEDRLKHQEVKWRS